MDNYLSSAVPLYAAGISPSTIVLCLAVAAITSVYIVKTVSAPLSALPGTFVSKWTTLPIRLSTAFGKRHYYVHALHARYGPIIRLSPTEVSVTSAQEVKQLYKMGTKFQKSKWYQDFTGNLKEPSMFTMIDDAQHGKRRRLVAHQFTERSIRALEPEIVAKNTRLAVEGIVREMKSEGFVDVFKWFVFMANDIICEASFAENLGTMAKGQHTDYTTSITEFTKASVFRTQLQAVDWIWSRLSPSRYGKSLGWFKKLAGYSEESFARYEQSLKENPNEIKPTLLSKMFASIEDGTISREQVRREGMGYIIAGTDTTANAATFAVYLLSQHPKYEQQVREQVATLPRDFSDEQLIQQPALCNAISEVLRLRGPVGQSLPRVVPPEGAYVGSFFVPGGSEIGAPAWTLHRDPVVWPSPNEFRPERWDKQTKEMREKYVPFGAGSRACIGMHLAQMELRYALATFYREFPSGVKLSNAHGFSVEEMTPVSYFVMTPKGKRCLIEPRESNK